MSTPAGGSSSEQQPRSSKPKLWTSPAKQPSQPLNLIDLTLSQPSTSTNPTHPTLQATPTTPPSPTLHSRIGNNFQARLPHLTLPTPTPFAPSAATTTSASSPLDGEPVWQPSKAPNSATVESYLSAVQDLFADRPDDFDEEVALLFLHRCGYSTSLALSLIQPHTFSRGDGGSDATAAVDGAASPPSDLSPASSSASEASSDDDTDDVCSVCLDGGTLIICERRGCRRVYHVDCAGLKEVPRGRWECPVHFCSICGDDWTEGGRRKKARLDSGAGSGSGTGLGGAAAGTEPLKPVTSHPSLISTSSQLHLLSPVSSPSTSFTNINTNYGSSPPPHIACTSCPTAYCLPHIPPTLAAAYSLTADQLPTLTLDSLQQRILASTNGVFLCLSCLGVQERRRRLDMLRRLNAVLDEREEKGGGAGGGGSRLGVVGGKGGGGRVEEREESGGGGDPLFALYSAFKQQELRDDEAAAADMSGTSEGLGFDRMLHHPTEWRRLEGTLLAVQQEDGKKAEPAGGANAKSGSAGGDMMKD